jgi:hypothetical protein
MKLSVSILALIAITGLPVVDASASTPIATIQTKSSDDVCVLPPPPQPSATESKANQNPIGQIGFYVKNSFLRFKNGSVQLYTNHQRCKDIRLQQRAYLAECASTLPLEEQKKALKYSPSAGGISYEDYDFLIKGKTDRGKLSNIVFMMFFASNFVPYAFMFFPDMLPTPFARDPNAKFGGGTSPLETLSRERTHAVIQTLLNMERTARVPPFTAKMNPFGGGKTKRAMEQMDRLGQLGGGILAAKDAIGSKGSEIVLKILHDEIYTEIDDKKKNKNGLAIVPSIIVKGLGKAMDPSSQSFLPGFLLKGKVLTSLRQMEDADDFLVDQKIDLETLSQELLQEACSDRLMGGPGRSVEENRESLASWLDQTVVQPSKVVAETPGVTYNGNLARVALMCYHAVDGARDARAASFLPRLLFQGQVAGMMTAGYGASTIQEQAKSISGAEEGKKDRVILRMMRNSK